MAFFDSSTATPGPDRKKLRWWVFVAIFLTRTHSQNRLTSATLVEAEEWADRLMEKLP